MHKGMSRRGAMRRGMGGGFRPARGAVSFFDPLTTLGERLKMMVWAPWEGGNAPASVAARAQNPSISSGAVLSIWTEWTGRSGHLVNQFGTGASWLINAVGGAAAFVCASQSYEQTVNPIALSNNVTLVAVYDRVGTGDDSIFGGTAGDPRLLIRGDGRAEWYDAAGDITNQVMGDGAAVLSLWRTPSVTAGRISGVEVGRKGGHDYGAGGIARWASVAAAGSRLSGRLVGLFAIEDITASELSELEVWAGQRTGIGITAGFSIETPTVRQMYQRQTSTTGVVRGVGSYDPGQVTSMDAQWAGGSWVPCTLVGGRWSVEVPGDVGRGTFRVRANGGLLQASVDNVSIGRKVAGKGQSNIKGSSELKTNLSDVLDIAIYDPRPAPMALMAGRSTRDTWGPAYDEGWVPTYLQTRFNADGVPWGMVRFAIGSTRIEWWEPTAAVDAAGLGYSVQYFDEFIRACIVADGRDPATYNPVTDGLVVEEVFIQIGEADARFGTSKAAFKASLSAIAAEIKARLGAAVIIRVSVLQDLFATGYVDTLAKLQAIQDAVTETIAEDPNVSAGPDFSDVVLDTDPPETNGNVHFFKPQQVALAASRWAPYPLAA